MCHAILKSLMYNLQISGLTLTVILTANFQTAQTHKMRATLQPSYMSSVTSFQFIVHTDKLIDRQTYTPQTRGQTGIKMIHRFTTLLAQTVKNIVI